MDDRLSHRPWGSVEHESSKRDVMEARATAPAAPNVEKFKKTGEVRVPEHVEDCVWGVLA